MANETVLTQVLGRPLDDGTERTTLQRLRRRVGAAVLAVAAVVVAWSLLAPLSGAVIAQGFVKTELNRKTVQHQEGGIVREILVREGQRVRAGDPLLVVGDVRSNALLDLYQAQWVSESVRQARLSAELAIAPGFGLPQGVADNAQARDYLAREQALFQARRRTLVEQLALLETQVEATQAQVRALSEQVASTAQGAALAREELDLNRSLARDGFVQRARLLPLERAVTDYDSRSGEQSSELALARQRLAELSLRATQARNQYQQQAAAELKDSTTRLREIEEQLRPARDLVERQYVRAPVDGEVMSMQVAAVGAVVGPREPLLEVVPAQEALVVEARVSVADIEHVQPGGAAEVRLTAYEYRSMPMLAARVTAVSADRIEDPRTGQTWFRTLVEVDTRELQAYPDARMQPGMPAEVFVSTPGRTLLQYVLQPLRAFASRGMREP